MANTMNSGNVDSLKAGQTLLVNARKVNNNKLHLEFAEIINATTRPTSALGLLNKSDERFSSSARRCWMTAEPADAAEVFGINLGADAPWEMTPKGEVLELNILNPEYSGVRFRVIVQETTEPTEWQAENLSKAAKRKGKDGGYITHNGDYIFSNTDVIQTNDDTNTMHAWLQPDSQTLEAAVNVETGELVEEDFDTSSML